MVSKRMRQSRRKLSNRSRQLSSRRSHASSVDSYEYEVLYQLCQVAINASIDPNATYEAESRSDVDGDMDFSISNSISTLGIQSAGAAPNGGSAEKGTGGAPHTRLKDDAKWENLRRWFVDHVNPDVRHSACVRQGMCNTTPLHLICQIKSVPLDIIEVVIESAPETVSWEDSNGWLPLHYACAKGASIEVLKALIKEYPEGQLVRDQRSRTPLHFAFYKSNKDDCNESIMSGENDSSHVETTHVDEMDYGTEMVLLLTGAVRIPDEKLRLPLHFAAAYGCSNSALAVLVDCYPDSLYCKEESGCTPLHYVMANAHNKTSPSCVAFLLKEMDQNAINENASDDNGNSPLQLLCIRATSNEDASLNDEKKARANIAECLKFYLNAKPVSSADFLTTLQSFPQWLRDGAVIHPHVKSILNRKISNRFPTAMLILDLYFYIVIIVCFSIATEDRIQYCFGLIPDIPAETDSVVTTCLVGATYFLKREVTQIISTISLGTFRAWILNPDNWLDICVVVLLYYNCFDMRYRECIMYEFGGSPEDQQFQTVATITIGLIWVALVSYLKSCSLEFSLFFETVLYVTRKIFVYLIVLVVILVAFAEMFLILFQNTPACNESCKQSDEWIFPHCTFSDSFIKVYTMMLGEVGEVNRYQHKLVSQFLYLAFVFLVAILLSNVLIAIITDSHSYVKNERAEMVFWSNRLDFVAEMDSIVAVKRNLMRCFGQTSHNYSSTDNMEPAEEESTLNTRKKKAPEPLRDLWIKMVMFLREDTDDTPMVETILYSFLKMLLILVIIPIWVSLGIISAGWLFPPQVREWIFIKNETQELALNTKNAEDMEDEIDKLKKEVKQIKAKTQAQLFAVRQDCLALRNEVEEMRISIQDELNIIKKVANALLRANTRQRGHID